MSKIRIIGWKNEEYLPRFFVFPGRIKMIDIEIILTTPKVLHRRIVDRDMEEIVKIKGTREGLVVLINARADFRAVQQRLIEKLSESNGFLEGTVVSIDVGPERSADRTAEFLERDFGSARYVVAPDHRGSEVP